jgi:hypothetical protein
MKQSPDIKKLEQILESSKLSSVGFMGTDQRSSSEIIDADLAEISRLGYSSKDIADKMQQITDLAVKTLGNWTRIDENNEAMVAEAKGRIPCPWPHAGNFAKRVTVLRNSKTGDQVMWSDLNIHLIAEHNFFEGKGSKFRIEPKKLIKMLF